MTLLAALKQHLNHGATSAHQLLDSDAHSGNIWLCAGMAPVFRWILLLLSYAVVSTGRKCLCLDRKGTASAVKHDGGKQGTPLPCFFETRTGAELRKDQDLGSHLFVRYPGKV